MKLSTLAVAGLAATANAASCRFRPTGVVTRRYYAGADGVDDIPGICGGLWDNLKRFPECAGISDPSCGQGEKGEGHLHWTFHINLACNPDMVQSAWWEATRNQWGHITCPQS